MHVCVFVFLAIHTYIHDTHSCRREKRVGGWRNFQEAPDAKKAKAASFKEESRDEVKHVVKQETWKKKWK